MMLSAACPAVHGHLTGPARNRGESVISDQHLVITAQ
jgi:hypothetical protein